MSWIKKTLTLFSIIAISVALLLLIDFSIGSFLIPCSEVAHLEVARCKNTNTNANSLRVQHPVYHHDLKKNGREIGQWGRETYELCTDENGFKTSCNSSNKSVKNFDIAFIGDSFTEGVGLAYEDTFVGQISKSRPKLKIANLGVSSYSPSIYFSKVNFLLEQGITFKELVVYIDISDIQDEANLYELADGIVVPKGEVSPKGAVAPMSALAPMSAVAPMSALAPMSAVAPMGEVASMGVEVSNYSSIKKWAHRSFPLTYYGLHLLKILYFPLDLDQAYLMADYQRGAWTYNPSSIGYGQGGVKGGIEQSLRAMTKLSDLLRDKGINLSVGVYPWPSQLLYDTAASEQVHVWENFCKTRCVRFYNSFDSFFALKDKISANKTIELYFVPGDVHHNRKGAEVIANDFLNLTEK